MMHVDEKTDFNKLDFVVIYSSFFHRKQRLQLEKLLACFKIKTGWIQHVNRTRNASLINKVERTFEALLKSNVQVGIMLTVSYILSIAGAWDLVGKVTKLLDRIVKQKCILALAYEKAVIYPEYRAPVAKLLSDRYTNMQYVNMFDGLPLTEVMNIVEFIKRRKSIIGDKNFYYRMLAATLNDEVTIKRAKVMFVGRGGAGKTSTIRSLLGKRFLTKMKSTIVADAKKQIDLSSFSVQNWDEHNIALNKTAMTNDIYKQIYANAVKYKTMAAGLSENDIDFTTAFGKILDDCSKKMHASELSTYNAMEKVKNCDSNCFVTWDFGGQKVFYALHHLFITENGLYCIVFNSFRLYHEINKAINEDISIIGTEKGHLKTWIESINSYAPNSKVICIGTHFAHLQQENEHGAIKNIAKTKNILIGQLESLFSLLSPHSNFKHDQVYFIDNSVSKKEVQKHIRPLQTAIDESVCEINRTYHPKIKMKWLIFMNDLLLQGQKSISQVELKERAKSIPAEVGAVRDNRNEELTSVLELYKNNGSILVFPDMVVLQPLWFIETLKLFLYCNMHQQNPLQTTDNGFEFLRDIFYLEKTGIISDSFFEKALKQMHCFDESSKELIIDFCTSASIMSPIQIKTLEEDNHYIFPSMQQTLRCLEPPKNIKGYNITCDRSLSLGIFQNIVCQSIHIGNDFGDSLVRNGFKNGKNTYIIDIPRLTQKEAKIRVQNIDVWIIQLTDKIISISLDAQTQKHCLGMLKFFSYKLIRQLNTKSNLNFSISNNRRKEDKTGKNCHIYHSRSLTDIPDLDDMLNKFYATSRFNRRDNINFNNIKGRQEKDYPFSVMMHDLNNSDKIVIFLSNNYIQECAIENETISFVHKEFHMLRLNRRHQPIIEVFLDNISDTKLLKEYGYHKLKDSIQIDLSNEDEEIRKQNIANLLFLLSE